VSAGNKEIDMGENKKKDNSKQKITANRRNSMHSTGPKTETGKLWSRMNAMKHGIFASELKVSNRDKPEFDLLHRTLRAQLKPASTLQQIGFERVVCGAWRWKLAIRLETKRWTLEPQDGREFQDGAHPARLPTNWYGASVRDLNGALRFLADVRQDVEANGWIHAERWKDPVYPDPWTWLLRIADPVGSDGILRRSRPHCSCRRTRKI
jgi:hypothetical protein